ncbi:hypothetical protein CkaCkLH20_05151 [Colletotrichum karsti]|uniref:Uncharacterized protein n=1 Tax=Colletotrichum karsti TaxID=1095194 RepID=A0A9P6I952_9PEZI|nr:uncharacterized protein CkaCkLH20_05151 [Colletotrichum karsti]KAF9877451.1 hypothetical protein CkaCkLH20_05151 [Colletotrichum karsti]
MTLTTRRIPKIGIMSTANWTVNEGSLHETAFLPREHSVRLERGAFMPKERGNHFFERHRLRLVFDPAPLPGKEHWRYKPAAEALRFWERDTFYAGQVAEGEGEGGRCFGG